MLPTVPGLRRSCDQRMPLYGIKLSSNNRSSSGFRRLVFQQYRIINLLRASNVEVAHQWHPNQGSGGQGEGEVLRQTKRHALEDEQLAGKVTQRNNVGPDGQVVHVGVVQVVRGIQTDDAREERPGAEATRSERCRLIHDVRRAGGGGDELVDRVLRVELFGLGSEFRVTNVFTVVEAA